MILAAATVAAAGLGLWSRDEAPLPAPPAQGSPPLAERAIRVPAVNAAEPASASDDDRELRTPSEWDQRFRDSDDYFAFVQTAAPAAIAGDGRAQHLLGRALVDCKVALIVADESEPSVRGTLAENADTRARSLRCERFRTAHPLDAFALPEEAKSSAYWRDKARDAHDALATIARAASTAAQIDSDNDAIRNAELKSLLMDDLRVALASPEPQVVLAVSSLYMQPEVAVDVPFQGPAWALAACELGYDCSQANPAVGFGCVRTGVCNGVATLADIYQEGLGAERFAKAYAAGQDIAYKLRTRDWEGLRPYLEMKPSKMPKP